MTKRPYFYFSGNELLKEFRDNKESPEILKRLLDELDYRKKTTKIIKLHIDIKAALENIIKRKSENNASNDDALSKKKQEHSSESKNHLQDIISKVHPVNIDNDSQETFKHKANDDEQPY